MFMCFVKSSVINLDLFWKQSFLILRQKFYNLDVRYYSPTAAAELCQSEGAELWEILDGEPEWEAVLAKVKTDQYSEAYEYGIWINGKVKQGCQGSFPFQKLIKPTILSKRLFPE